MAGAPLRKAMIAEIKDRGGEDWLFDLVASGTPVLRIAEQYLNCGKSMLYRWLREDPGRREALKRAREESGHALVEEGLDIVDNADEDNVQVAKERASMRKFMASRYNRADFGEQNAPQVAISIGSLHLASLQTVAPEVLQVASDQIEVLPAETGKPEDQQ